MSSTPLARLRNAARRHLLDRGARPAPDAGRRQFFRRAGAGAAGLIGTGLLLPDEAWAGVEERAAQAGITPGTVVDARGRRVRNPSGFEPFIGEIMIFGGNFAVKSYAMCNGQLMSIAQNSALFSILGTIYGGDGQSTFGLPNLQSRVPMHFGAGPGLSTRDIGEVGGTEQTTLNVLQMPVHEHPHSHNQPASSALGTVRSPSGNIPGSNAEPNFAPPTSSNATLSATTVNSANAGGSQPVGIMPPFLALNFQIALFGVFPSRS